MAQPQGPLPRLFGNAGSLPTAVGARKAPSSGLGGQRLGPRLEPVEVDELLDLTGVQPVAVLEAAPRGEPDRALGKLRVGDDEHLVLVAEGRERSQLLAGQAPVPDVDVAVLQRVD